VRQAATMRRVTSTRRARRDMSDGNPLIFLDLRRYDDCVACSREVIPGAALPQQPPVGQRDVAA
jgi:hypothetical protein